jgi:hypothetical protein
MFSLIELDDDIAVASAFPMSFKLDAPDDEVDRIISPFAN